MNPIIEKIQKLLALSESPNQHEAEAAAQKAQEMLSKHNLTIDSISMDSNSSDIIDATRFDFTGSMKKWRQRLMSHVTTSVDCDAVYHFNYNNTICAVTIYGLEQNVQAAIYIYKYLEYTIDRLRKAYVKQFNKDHKARTGNALNLNERYHVEKSYTLGIVRAVSYKLKQQKTDTPPTPGALVPIIGALIEKKKLEDCPGLKNMQKRRSTIINAAFTQGHVDGNGIAIHKGISTDNNQQLTIGQN